MIDLSTVSVEASAQVRAGLAARGTEFLAAPVMGNPRVAAAGRLTFAVSGSPARRRRGPALPDILGAGASYVGDGEIAQHRQAVPQPVPRRR